jgi:ABC-type polar amino acid transport system ATPase subunit
VSPRVGADRAPLLVVEDLVKAYGAHRAIDGVSLRVHPGEVLCLIGPSGSGKSTLLRCVNGLERIEGGRVLFDGRPVVSGSRQVREVRRRMGMVFQNFELFPHLTALGNVTIGPRTVLKLPRAEAESRAMVLLAKVGLVDHARKHPAQLSGGQQQRVAIARALVTRPEVVFADEPTGALDTRTGREILALLRHVVDDLGQTVVMVTHDPVAAAHADRVLFLADGRLAGTLERPDADQVAERLAHLGD